MKIASLQYRYDFLQDFSSYANKISQLVKEQADEGVDLILFPEYSGLEMLSFTSEKNIHDYFPAYIDLFKKLSSDHKLYICSGTHMGLSSKEVFNRAYFFSPGKDEIYQDKCVLTPFEEKEGIFSKSNNLKVIETPFCKIGILVCYDIEFPSLARTLVKEGVELILVPSYTNSREGFHRVFISCRARALENQCYVVQSAIVGQTDVEMAYGASAICAPIDKGFPEDGILALGKQDAVQTVKASLDFNLLKIIRDNGQTKNHLDSYHLEKRTFSIETINVC
jgi:predicted amidohydrolase